MTVGGQVVDKKMYDLGSAFALSGHAEEEPENTTEEKEEELENKSQEEQENTK